MLVAIAGKNSIAIEITKYVLSNFSDYQLCAIVNRTDNGVNGFEPSFRKFANDTNVPIVELSDVYNIDDLIFISLEFDRIIKPNLFKSKKLFNVHFSKLPAYKGMYTSALPILNSESTTAVTLHEIDSGIDTGDVIDQRVFEITEQDTAKSLYLKYLNYGITLVVRNIESILYNKYKATAQSSVGSSYYSKFAIDYRNIIIDLNNTAWMINSQIRAFTFREYQMPMVMGRKIAQSLILETKSHCKQGTIIAQDFQSITIASIDYDIKLFFDFYDDLLECCKIDDVDSASKIVPYIDDINQKDYHGWTPLIVAAYNNAKRVAEMLLANGADVNAQNYKGTSVLMYAKDGALMSGDKGIIDVVFKAGADIDIIDENGKSVMDYVIDQEQDIYRHIQTYKI